MNDLDLAAGNVDGCDDIPVNTVSVHEDAGGTEQLTVAREREPDEIACFADQVSPFTGRRIPDDNPALLILSSVGISTAKAGGHEPAIRRNGHHRRVLF